MSAVKRRGRLEEGSRVLLCGDPAVVAEVSATGVERQESTGTITQLAWLDLVEAGRVRR